MRIGPLALVVLAFMGAAGGAAQPSSDAAVDPHRGAELFRARGCLECHAKDLPALQRQPRSAYALAAAMWNHFPLMAEHVRLRKLATPYLASGEMRDVAAFLGVDPSSLGRAGDARRGEELVRAKGCLACHSTAAPRGPRASALRELKGLDTPWAVMAQMWNHAFLMELETQAQAAAWPRLTADETADVVPYLRELMRTR